jgi:hypothetical protein
MHGLKIPAGTAARNVSRDERRLKPASHATNSRPLGGCAATPTAAARSGKPGGRAGEDNFHLTGVMKFRPLPQDDLHDRGVSMSKVGARSEH